MSRILLFTIIFLTQNALAAYKDTDGVKVQLISAWANNGDILLQTNPRHSIEGLNCQGDYWLTLKKNSPGYEAILSMLLSAQATQKTILVRAEDSGTDFCNLTRVIANPN